MKLSIIAGKRQSNSVTGFSIASTSQRDGICNLDSNSMKVKHGKVDGIH